MSKNLLYRLAITSGVAEKIVDLPILARGLTFVPNLGKLFFVIEHPTNGFICWLKKDNTVSQFSNPGSIRGGRGLIAHHSNLISEDLDYHFRAVNLSDTSVKNIVGKRGQAQLNHHRRQTKFADHKLNGFAINKYSNSIFYASPEHHHIFAVKNSSLIGSVIGSGTPGFSISSNPEHNMLNTPTGIAVTNDDRIFITDKGNHVIREFMQSNGIVVVGRTIGAPEINGQVDGKWQDAKLDSPSAISCDSKFIYFVDNGGKKIKSCNLNSMEINTIYQTNHEVRYLTIGRPNELYFSEWNHGTT